MALLHELRQYCLIQFLRFLRFLSGGEALHALLKRAHHRRVIHRRGELVHVRGSKHRGLRVLLQQSGQLF